MTDLDLIIDLHLLNDRQAPGGDQETRRAIELARLSRSEPLKVADIGCGTGASCLVLAQDLNAHVTAVDAAAPFIDRLRARTAEAGLADRIEPTVGHMESLPFEDDQFDVIWSEGAIYNMGFADGLRAWRRFLRPQGVIVASELTWTTPTRPADVEAHWTREYPGITTPAANLQSLEQAGYEPLAMFFIPPDCWRTNYYDQLQSTFPAFLERHATDAAKRLIAAEEAEIAMHQQHGRWYGYAFYIARKADTPPPDVS